VDHWPLTLDSSLAGGTASLPGGGISVDYVARVLQRNTVEPGEFVMGAVVVERPQERGCMVEKPNRWRGASGPATESVPVPCRFSIATTVGGEVHTITFDEIEPSN
jgi:hypothetical protein